MTSICKATSHAGEGLHANENTAWLHEYSPYRWSGGTWTCNFLREFCARADSRRGYIGFNQSRLRAAESAGDASGRIAPSSDGTSNPFEFSARGGFASDYIYRGTTLSAHRPAVGAAFELTALGFFYASTTFASVKLPSQPASEITMGGGIRPKLGDISFDFGWTRYYYPGETPPPDTVAGIEYWETTARADTKIGDALRVAGGFAYSPNVSNTGAWSKYAAFGLGVDIPAKMLPPEVSVSLTGVVGYSWFGNQSPELGGFPLPAYTNWNAGVTLTRKNLNLDLRYYDTNLSKEDCFVFTGDPGAVPGQYRSSQKSGRPYVTLVQRDFCGEVLVCVELGCIHKNQTKPLVASRLQRRAPTSATRNATSQSAIRR